MNLRTSFLLLVGIVLTFIFACNMTVNKPEKTEDSSDIHAQLDKLNLPKGFEISVYADNVKNARSMTMNTHGTLFVGTRSEGNVYALKDTDGDNIVDVKYTILSNGNMPNGVAVWGDDLYIAEVNRILKISNIETKLGSKIEPEIIYDQYPTIKHHGWKFISFGPDGKLYVPVGAPCNICESEDRIFNTITRINRDGTDVEIVQEGVRNTVGFTWHPETKELWFSDNGRDMMGDDLPACELNYAPRDFMHFGYPYCHQGDLPDPEFGHLRNCDEFTAPAQNLGAHTAPLGISFYAESSFPNEYRDSVVFIAEHGSWNRSKKIGYRVSMVRLSSDFEALSYEPFIDGWLNTETDQAWGRPVDIEVLKDGSMLVSDDFADAIYRIVYTGKN